MSAITRPAVFDVNAFLRADETLKTIAGKRMNYYPIIGDGDDNGPFVVYYYNPTIPSVESYWNRYDVIDYVIFDNNIERMYKLGEQIIYLLGRGDATSEPGGIEGQDTRIFSTYLIDTSVEAAEEKDGWFKMNLSFAIYYVAK